MNTSPCTFPLDKMIDLLRYSYKNIEFYREAFDRIGIVPDSITSYDEFIKIPLLDKSVVRDITCNINKFYSKEYHTKNDQLFLFKTSGSTGIPIYCLKTRMEKIKGTFSAWKVRKWWNNEIVGKPAVGIIPGIGLSNQVKQGGRDLILSTNGLSEDVLHDYCRRIIEFKPIWMYGYPSAIHKLALFIKDRNEYRSKIRISFIELQGEYVIPEYKNEIKEIFQCGVSNQYGCTETWVIAYSCPNEKLHVLEDDVFVEILDDNGLPVKEGEVGEIVITSLVNRSMSFLRYRLGDQARFIQDKCICGRTLKCIELVGTRTNQKLKLSDGRISDGSVFYEVLIEICKGMPISNYFRTFKIIQKDINRLEVYFLPGRDYLKLKDTFNIKFVEIARKAIDSNFQFQFIEEQSLESTVKKHNYFISEI
jgi:phenylacetate-CoA ligase